MSDDLQKSFDRLLGNEPKRPSMLWLVFGVLLGVGMQVGPGIVAGVAGWSAWWAIGWGCAVGFHSTVVKSNIGRGMMSGSLPPHWLSAVVTVVPLSMGLFAALNYACFWLFRWLIH